MSTRDNVAGGTRGPRPSGSNRLLRAITIHYGIGTVRHVEDIGGTSNLNLLIETEHGQYVARAYRSNATESRLSELQRVRNTLRAAGVPCAPTAETIDGQSWISYGNTLVEVEDYIAHDACMDNPARLITALPVLGRIHTILRDLKSGPELKYPLFANHVETGDLVAKTALGTQRIRGWPASSDEMIVADVADRLAQLLNEADPRSSMCLPRQLVHGDFWDNNVCFRDGRVSLVADFDFMGERSRVDDLAIPLYFASMKYADTPFSGEHLAGLRSFCDAYETGLSEPLTGKERTAIPLVLASQPLWSIGGWVAILDDDEAARQHALMSTRALRWGTQIMHEIDRWQQAFA